MVSAGRGFRAGAILPRMKALLVTSEVTFIPRNYDDLITGMASCPQVGGLLVLRNRDGALARKALGLILLGARGLGTTLLKNQVFGSLAHDLFNKEEPILFAVQGKPWLPVTDLLLEIIHVS